MDRVSDAVGTSLLFENRHVRVWDFALDPGEWSELHRHSHDYVVVYATPAELVVESPGAGPEVAKVADGYVSETRLGAGPDGHLIHRVRNTGSSPLRHFVIEFLEERGSGRRGGRTVTESNDAEESPCETL